MPLNLIHWTFKVVKPWTMLLKSNLQLRYSYIVIMEEVGGNTTAVFIILNNILTRVNYLS